MNPIHRTRRMTRPLVLALSLSALTLGTSTAAQARTTSEATVAEATSNHDSSPSRPTTFVASSDGVIVLVSSTTGRVVRALTTGRRGGRDSDPYVANSGRTVVFVRSTGSCSSSILAVPRWGGHTRVLVPRTTGVFTRPKLSNDGRLLAYQSNNCAAGRATLMVRTLRTGATHSIGVPVSGEANDYTFTANGRRLVAVVASVTEDRVSVQVRSIPVGARTTAAGRVLDVAEPGCFATRVTQIGRSRYIAVDQYCPSTGMEKVLKVDNRTGRSVGRLALVPISEIGLAGIDFDAAGGYLLLQGETNNVYTAAHANLIVIATGLQSATW